MTRKGVKHELEVETKPGRNYDSVRSRWTCRTCGVGGDWTTPDKAHAGGETHVAGRAGEKLRKRHLP